MEGRFGHPRLPPQSSQFPPSPPPVPYQVGEAGRLDLAAVGAAAAVRDEVNAEFTLWGQGDRAGDTRGGCGGCVQPQKTPRGPGTGRDVGGVPRAVPVPHPVSAVPRGTAAQAGAHHPPPTPKLSWVPAQGGLSPPKKHENGTLGASTAV